MYESARILERVKNETVRQRGERCLQATSSSRSCLDVLLDGLDGGSVSECCGARTQI